MRFDRTFLKNDGFKIGWEKMLLKIDQIDLSPLKKKISLKKKERKNLLFPFQLLIIIFEVWVSPRKPLQFILLKELKSSSIHFPLFFPLFVWQHGTKHLSHIYRNKRCKSELQDHENIISIAEIRHIPTATERIIRVAFIYLHIIYF